VLIDTPLSQLIKETESLLETEKKKLEEKQNKTQEEIETLEQLNITYKLVNGGRAAWKDIPMIVSENKSPITYKSEMLGLKSRIQLLELEKVVFEGQAQQIQLLGQRKSKLISRINEKNSKIDSLKRENQELKKTLLHSEQQEQEQVNRTKPENAVSSGHELSDDPDNDINYDTEIDNTDD
jgi:hypothetical protein